MTSVKTPTATRSFTITNVFIGGLFLVALVIVARYTLRSVPKPKVVEPKMGEIQNLGGGLLKEIKTKGSGDETPPKGASVEVHYVGKLESGKEFDSSRKKGKTFKFVLGQQQVIKGWDLGVATMKKGERSDLTCPPDFAYGDQDVGGGLIPAGSTLIFDVELLGWN